MQQLEPEAGEAVGLMLTPEGDVSPYDATPARARVFARTGGDGVHFSFLSDPDAEPSDWPVVMTVPMQFDRPNLVVGSNLAEFLALGLNVGYFVLEQLAYDFGAMVNELDRGHIDSDPPELMQSTLAAIAREFSIVPWDSHRLRLEWLQNHFPQAVEN